MSEKLKFIKKKDLKYTYHPNCYHYLVPKLEKLPEDMNKILFNYFSADIILNCLFQEYRSFHKGFNLNFSIDFLIYIFNHFKYQEKIYDYIFPLMKRFLIDKDIDKKEIDFINRHKISLLPYMQLIIRELIKDLNNILKENFDRIIIQNCLYANLRSGKRKRVGFNCHFAIEFLIYIFEYFNNESDIKNLILPLMEEFLKEKEQIEIVG